MAALTPHPDVNNLLADLLVQVAAILGQELVGFYVDGSLALGDFDPATSDVDFIAAVKHPLPADTVEALATMHRHITLSGRPFATELEGSYIHLAALRRHDPNDALHPNIERGIDEVLRPKEHHSDWVIHRHIAREHGLTLCGPPAAALIVPVSSDDIRRATAGVLRSWWGTNDAAESIRRVHPIGLAYIALTMCRALYALKYGDVVSKPAAAEWALASLDARWHMLIKRSLRWDMIEAMREETAAFVWFVVSQAPP